MDKKTSAMGLFVFIALTLFFGSTFINEYNIASSAQAYSDSMYKSLQNGEGPCYVSNYDRLYGNNYGDDKDCIAAKAQWGSATIPSNYSRVITPAALLLLAFIGDLAFFGLVTRADKREGKERKRERVPTVMPERQNPQQASEHKSPGTLEERIVQAQITEDVDDLPKSEAGQLDTVARSSEENVVEEKRHQDLEEKQAPAGGITMQEGAGIQAEKVPSAQLEEDPIERLAKLKKMLDAGLITGDEFNAKKTDILSRM